MALDVDALPVTAVGAVTALGDGLRTAFTADLDAVYVYGAITFPETEGTGDLDFHAFLRRTPSPEQIGRLAEMTRDLALNHAPLGADLDGWIVATEAAKSRDAPKHLLKQGMRDESWALHRAHWLVGRVVVLLGPSPREFVVSPRWDELEAGLRGEWGYLVHSNHDAFAILNACRVLISYRDRNVVVSKFRSAAWAIEHLPPEYHPVIGAALATYRGERLDLPIEGRSSLTEYVSDRLPFG